METGRENISLVMSGFQEVFNHMLKTQSFNLQAFVNFMEPRFAAAGYRTQNNNSGGGYFNYF